MIWWFLKDRCSDVSVSLANDATRVFGQGVFWNVWCGMIASGKAPIMSLTSGKQQNLYQDLKIIVCRLFLPHVRTLSVQWLRGHCWGFCQAPRTQATTVVPRITRPRRFSSRCYCPWSLKRAALHPFSQQVLSLSYSWCWETQRGTSASVTKSRVSLDFVISFPAENKNYTDPEPRWN